MTCPHGFDRPSQCIDCMDDDGLGAAPTPPEQRDGHAIYARSDGDCGVCNLPIHAGERIVHTTRDRWVHADCCRERGTS